MSLEEEFRLEVSKYLITLNEKLELQLKKLIEFEYPNEVVSLGFEVFVDNFTDGFPVRVFFIDSENSEFFVYKNGKAEYPSPIDPSLLDIDYVYPYELEDQYVEKDDDFDPWSIATDELILWFSKRWLVSGGDTFKLHSSIAPHDSAHEFDLKESKWVERY